MQFKSLPLRFTSSRNTVGLAKILGSPIIDPMSRIAAFEGVEMNRLKTRRTPKPKTDPRRRVLNLILQDLKSGPKRYVERWRAGRGGE